METEAKSSSSDVCLENFKTFLLNIGSMMRSTFRQKLLLGWIFFFAVLLCVPSENTEGSGFMTWTASCHKGAMMMMMNWLHLGATQSVVFSGWVTHCDSWLCCDGAVWCECVNSAVSPEHETSNTFVCSHKCWNLGCVCELTSHVTHKC